MLKVRLKVFFTRFTSGVYNIKHLYMKGSMKWACDVQPWLLCIERLHQSFPADVGGLL